MHILPAFFDFDLSCYVSGAVAPKNINCIEQRFGEKAGENNFASLNEC